MSTEERQEILEDINSSVDDFFWSYCGEDGYDSFRDRLRDMQAMAAYANDPMVDHCIDVISEDFPDIDLDEEFRSEIVDRLAQLADYEIN